MDELKYFQQLYAVSASPVEYHRNVYRLVETQEIAATTNLVDDLDEQYLLEKMLDEVKPAYRNGTEEMHYLLKAPFRYPPLKHGSRFGSRFSPSYFYAGEDQNTTLAEVAYYRFVFLSHMQISYEKSVRSEHMMYRVAVKSARVVDLSSDDFDHIRTKLVSPDSYVVSQQVGQWLVEKKQIEVIRYCSARHEEGINVAIALPHALHSNEPEKCQSWLCLVQKNKVSFTRMGGLEPISFYRRDFLIEGHLPIPA
ncbi:MAG: hypothetical protein ACI88A_000708 [Paraglaciecola sp.]|jgi:hypothetical protein